jgi:hypothetical protein
MCAEVFKLANKWAMRDLTLLWEVVKQKKQGKFKFEAPDKKQTQYDHAIKVLEE